VLAVTGALGAAGWLRRPSPGPVATFAIEVPENAKITGSLTVAPDGARFIYASQENGLLIRELSALTPKPIAGTGEAWSAVFSPDGQSIAMASGFPGALKVVPLGGGNPLQSALARLSYESDRATQLLAWQPRVGVREGIRRVAE